MDIWNVLPACIQRGHSEESAFDMADFVGTTGDFLDCSLWSTEELPDRQVFCTKTVNFLP